MPSQSKLSIWRKFFIETKELGVTNLHIGNIKKASKDSNSFAKFFDDVSKNEGISFLILDPTETHIQILHHGHILGGSWSIPTKKMVAVLGSDDDAKPVQIIQKSIKNIKDRALEFQNLKSKLEKEIDFARTDGPHVDFNFKNILPIPDILTKAFVQLDSTSPYAVAKAFMSLILETNDQDLLLDSSFDLAQKASEDEAKETNSDDENTTDLNKETNVDKNLNPKVFDKEDLLYAVQFCHLCAMGKIPPVLYSLSPDKEISSWFKKLQSSKGKQPIASSKRRNPPTPDSDSDSEISSPDNKISRKDHYFINTMKKLHDTMDKSSKSKEEKEPGFRRLEAHRKTLILNASAAPPFTEAAEEPTDFFATFLSKKSQFKAKDMLLHHFQGDKISFNPNPTFITNMWNSKFFLLLPDSPSGISVLYCPETKSSNTYELERERNLALADKVNASDIEKLSKQKITIPTSLMDLVWQIQNFHAVISLCFGTKSHLASFLQSWIDHVYDNRIIYTSIQSSNPYFFSKVLFTIDSALQRHWRSCSSAPDRPSVNDNCLRMSDTQDSILGMSFS
jgi:hypothetical protein